MNGKVHGELFPLVIKPHTFDFLFWIMLVFTIALLFIQNLEIGNSIDTSFPGVETSIWVQNNILIAEVSLGGKNWLIGEPEIAISLAMSLKCFPHSELGDVS